jgi:hypothetical protein
MHSSVVLIIVAVFIAKADPIRFQRRNSQNRKDRISESSTEVPNGK